MGKSRKNGKSGSTGFGVDIGGSGIKGARVDRSTGEFIGDRIRIDTPQPATPGAGADTVSALVEQAEWTGPIGLTVPAVVVDQTARTAANIDPSWIGTDCQSLFGDRLTVDGAARPVSRYRCARSAVVRCSASARASVTAGEGIDAARPCSSLV